MRVVKLKGKLDGGHEEKRDEEHMEDLPSSLLVVGQEVVQ